MLIKFPYHYKKTVFGNLPDPLVDLEVKTPRGWQKLRFLVDSGADVTTLPLFLAQMWGIRIDRSQEVAMDGVGEEAIAAYPGRLTVRLGDQELTLRCYFVASETIPLLGRLDLWSRFDLIFDNRRQMIVLRQPARWRQWLAKIWRAIIGGNG